jgi:three-Cys-motif partner protein
VRETCEVVDGSPLVALQYNFSRYVFVDVPDVIATLRERLKNHPKKDCIRLIEGDCNTVVDDIRAELPPNHWTLAFIDPTGLQIQFQTMKRLVEARKIDLLMTIQFGMGIKMNIHQYIAADVAALSGFLGNDLWREDVAAGGTISDICQRILTRYIGELQKLGFGGVRQIPIHNQNNLLLYFIVLASRHPLGEEFWRKITDIKSSGQRRLF